MMDKEQARDFIETALNGLEKSVIEKNEQAIQKSKQEFNSLISEYKRVMGTKDADAYTQNYAEIMKKGGYLK